MCSEMIKDSDLSFHVVEAPVESVSDPSQTKMATPMITHSGKKKHICVQWHKSFGQTETLKRHMLTHTGEKTHTCSECKKSFGQAGHLKAHMVREGCK